MKKPLDRTVGILGVTYVVVFKTLEQEPRFESCDGFIDVSIKEIVIHLIEPTERSIQDIQSYMNKVIRHEIIHAFLYESGLWNNSASCVPWASNEEMVDWLAIQFHKIQAAFTEVDCACTRERGM